jgi:hypothetical protein
MSTQGRSLDDLPLAAYTTGMRPDERLEELEAHDAAHAEEARAAEESLQAHEAAARRRVDEEVAQDARAAARALDAANEAATGLPTDPEGLGAPQRIRAPHRLRAFAGRLAIPAWLADPRRNPRDPRLLMSGVIGIGVVLLVASVALGGPRAGAGAPVAAPSARPVAAATPHPGAGDATVEVRGKLAGEFALTGASGTGPATGGRVAVTWVDTTGSSLALAGPASSGTRTTDAVFSLTWTTVVDGAPIAFTSTTGECTVGMALQPGTVTGSFVCKKLKSSDGKLTIDVRGTYRT